MDPFTSLSPGATARITKVITQKDIEAFAALSGDYNPLHLDEQFARSTRFQKPVVHGMLVASYVSTLVGMHLPGAGALWTQQNFRWHGPVYVGDSVELTVTLKYKSNATRTLSIEVSGVNQNRQLIMNGEGTVMILDRKEKRETRPLRDCVALVSGAARGIGAAVARKLASLGACTAVNYVTSHDAALALCREIEAAGGHALAVQADIRCPAAVMDAVSAVRRHFGRPVDVLVNNASLPPVPRAFLELDWDHVQQFFDVQIQGAFRCTQAVIPAMMEQKFGRIVNIGAAITRQVPPAHWCAFNVSKAALHGLTRSLAAEFGPHGIRVNTVSPGLTDTDSNAIIPDRQRKLQAIQTPLRRLADPTDVANAVAFLCSEASDYITGADLPVTGGASV